MTTFEELLAITGTMAVGYAITIVVLVAMLRPLEVVMDTVEEHVTVSFWSGVGVQFLILPVFLVLVLALVLSIVGILLVPVAVLLFIVAMCGWVTMGGVAVAGAVGRATLDRTSRRSRARLLRAVTVGYVIVWLPWIAAAVTDDVPVLGVLLRIAALATSWVLFTVGMGAVFRARAGRRPGRSRRSAYEEDAATARDGARTPAYGARGVSTPASDSEENAADWATPTPLHGVAAVRRPN